MRDVLAFFVRRPLLVNVLMIVFFIGGIVAMGTLPYNTFPSADSGLISITTNYPGASAEDVELSVTIPLEREFLHIDGVDKVISNSVEGQSTIMVIGYPNDTVDRYDEVEVEIYNAIDRARSELPAGPAGNPVVGWG